jgi:hypothetical protein
MMENLHKQYSIAYASTKMKRDGKPPKIKVKTSPEVEKREGNLEILIGPPEVKM